MQPQSQSDQYGFSEPLESRLRNLPPLPVPGDLEARLLAAIPAENISKIPIRVRVSHRWRTLRVAAGVTFSAACLLMMVLLWPKFGDHDTSLRLAVDRDNGLSAHQTDHERHDESFNIVTRLEERRCSMEVESQLFTWPIHETSPLMVSSKFPRDLLD